MASERFVLSPLLSLPPEFYDNDDDEKSDSFKSSDFDGIVNDTNKDAQKKKNLQNKLK